MKKLASFIGILILCGCSNDPYHVAENLLQQLSDNELIVGNIGEPITIGDIKHEYEGETTILKAQVIGEVNGLGDDKKARLVFPLRGPKGQVLIDIDARVRKGVWVVSNLRIKEDGKYSGKYSVGVISLAKP